jgi:hypothetical protein
MVSHLQAKTQALRHILVFGSTPQLMAAHYAKTGEIGR